MSNINNVIQHGIREWELEMRYYHNDMLQPIQLMARHTAQEVD